MSLFSDASLAMIPSAYKDGKLYSIKPTDGSGDFTFTRGSNLAATRVDVNGLIEKGRENLILQSNSFNNWTNSNTTETSGQSGYDGTSDAWLLEKSAASAFIYRAFSGSGVYSLSIYAKEGTLNSIFLLIVASGGNGNAYFNLSTGVVDSFGNNAFDAQIEDVGGGWYRCSLIGSYTSISQVRIYPANNETLADTSGSIYIQDAQLEQGLVATDYIETTTTTAQAGILEDMPRLDYSGGASCPSLLLEPQRSNLIKHSEYILDASGAWYPNTITITDNYGTSPEGVKNSTRLVLDNLVSSRIAYIPTLTDGTTYTFSCWYKGTAGEKLYMEGNGSGGSGTFTNKLITLTGDWQREDLQFVGGSTSNLIYIVDSRNGSEDTAQDFEVWGAQLEEGSYPTSYIPTYGTSQTRSVDRNLLSTIPVDTSNNYTIFMDFFRISDNEHTTKWFDLRGNGGTYIQFYMISGGGRFRIFFKGDADASAQNITDENNPQKDEQYKLALVRTDSSLKLFANGSLIQTRTDKIPDELDYYAEWNENRINNHMLFPTALTDSECIALTQ